MILKDYQIDALNKMHNGCILCGGVGSGKTLTSLAYVDKNGFSEIYIITTARKRDTKEWENDILKYGKFKHPIRYVIDSWNNIKKYIGKENAFFIFDEQRVIGYGSWAKDFLKIASKNKWVLLSATPGDTWQEYIAVFIANGFYKNKSEFLNEHAVFSKFSKFPKIERYVNEGRLSRQLKSILVPMNFERKTTQHHVNLVCNYDYALYRKTMHNRWDYFENKPIEQASTLCYALRKIVNDNSDKDMAVLNIHNTHPKIIIFYNFDYELERLKNINYSKGTVIREWNGHKHEPIPSESNKWVYLVQYTAGAEGWNCVETNAMIFFSESYSYKIMIQSAGRIDRMNTTFSDLYFYHLITNSRIDLSISNALSKKKNFNEKNFVKSRR